MPAQSDLRIGSSEDVADAVTRSHLGDGRVLGWYGDPGVVVDAEIDRPVPPALAARFGESGFWRRWTRAECAAKLAGVPMHVWLREHGLSASAYDMRTVRLGDLVVSIGRPARPV